MSEKDWTHFEAPTPSPKKAASRNWFSKLLGLNDKKDANESRESEPEKPSKEKETNNNDNSSSSRNNNNNVVRRRARSRRRSSQFLSEAAVYTSTSVELDLDKYDSDPDDSMGVHFNENDDNDSDDYRDVSPKLDKKQRILTRLKDSNFRGGIFLTKEYWMPDENCLTCYECSAVFTTFVRRHHCRLCGQIFCWRCSSNTVDGRPYGIEAPMRTCNHCYALINDEDFIAMLDSTLAGTAADGLSSSDGGSVSPSQYASTARVLFPSALSASVGDFMSPVQARTRPPRAPLKPPHIDFGDDVEFGVGRQRYGDDTFESSSSSSASPSSSLSSSAADLHAYAHAPADSISLLDLGSLSHGVGEPMMMTERSKTSDVAAPSLKRSLSLTSVNDALLDGSGGGRPPRSKPHLVSALYTRVPLSFETPMRADDGDTAVAPLRPPSGDDRSKSDDDDDDDDVNRLLGEWSSNELDQLECASGSISEPSLMNEDVSHLVASSPASVSHDVSAQPSMPPSPSSPGVTMSADDEARVAAMMSSSPPGAVNMTKMALLRKRYMSMPRGNQQKSSSMPRLRRFTTPDREALQRLRGQLRADRSDSADSDTSVDPIPTTTTNLQSKQVMSRLTGHGDAWLMRLASQLVYADGLDQAWTGTIVLLAMRAAEFVEPDLSRGDFMDVRNYVSVKKIPGGSLRNCTYVDGVVFSKNIAHKRMRSSIANPRVLLLGCAIEYQRVANRMVSFDVLQQQEREYLSILVAKLAALKPDVLFVQGTVSGMALEFLLAARISVIINVQRDLLSRIARFTDASILPSTETGMLGNPKLGTCSHFSVCTFPGELPLSKHPLIMLSGCERRLGGTIVLRGASRLVLYRIKRILLFVTYAAYHMRLERKLLVDTNAMPPLPVAHIERQLEDMGGSLSSSSSSTDDTGVDVHNASAAKFFALMNAEYLTTPIDDDDDDDIKSRQEFDALMEPVLSVSPNVTFRRFAPRSRFEPKLVMHVPVSFVRPTLYALTRWPRATINRESLSNAGPPVDRWALLPLDFSRLFHFEDRSLPARELGDAGGSLTMGADSESLTDTSTLVFRGRERKRRPACSRELLAVAEQQHIVYVHALFCRPSLNLCVPFDLHVLDYYSPDDMPLGAFLMHYCFDAAAKCTINGCGGRLVDHERTFLHAAARVDISVQTYTGERPSKYDADDILTCSHCTECGRLGPFQPLRGDSLRMGFAKYLELLFYSHDLVPARAHNCRHSMHRHHTRYFLRRDLVVLVEYKPLSMFAVAEPPLAVRSHSERHPELVRAELSYIRTVAVELYTHLEARLQHALALAADSAAERVDQVHTLLSDHARERDLLLRTLESADIGYFVANRFQLNIMRRTIYANATTWSATLNELSANNTQATTRARSNSSAAAPPLQQQQQQLRQSTAAANHQLSITRARRMFQDDKEKEAEEQVEVEEEEKEKEEEQVEVEEEEKEQVDVEKIDDDDTDLLPLSTMLAAAAASSSSSTSTNNNGTKLTLLVDNARLPKNLATLFGSKKVSYELRSFFRDAAGLFLPLGVDDVPLAIYGKELSSMITYSLSSTAYERAFVEKFGYAPVRRGGAAMSSDERASAMAALFKVHRSQAGHIETKMVEEVHGSRIRLTCRSFFAHGFHTLRRLCCGGDDSDFLASLARCKDWEARGGKSGSSWDKTLDERYILKQISRPEFLSFLEFGPLYFRYMGEIFSKGIPTVLAKVVGVYYVHYRCGSRTVKQTVMVQENLFCGRNVSQVYDLKGSLRSRYVKAPKASDGTDVKRSDEVWLDENLLEYIYQEPIALDELSKARLITSIYNDTLFLSHHAVMDYSLLVGIDESTNELVVGIIDYMRKYTWDKQLESWIKLSGVLGGRGRVPTVISPEQYMTRFREQMWLYFILVPNKLTCVRRFADDTLPEFVIRPFAIDQDVAASSASSANVGSSVLVEQKPRSSVDSESNKVL
jgi:1-phosphatidylinositol-3-phosphate 5-kinase